MENVLTIKSLNVSFGVYGGSVKAVRDLSLQVKKGEILALVGESGCGKSVTARSILRLDNSPSMKLAAKELTLGDFDILRASEKELEQMRGNLASMVFQDPLTCLNPTMKVGKQIVEAAYRKKKWSAAECKEEAVRLLEMVKIPDARARAEQYPHQFSGGMRQRIMIAMALLGSPQLLIADEPTTALDVTIQLQILKLLADIKKEKGTAVLLITHDFGVVANLADRVAVMYAGRIVEEGSVEEIFSQPMHPYTKGLLKSMPKPGMTGRLISIPGEPPDLYAPPKGCSFARRCHSCMKICLREEPPVLDLGDRHQASCFLLYQNAQKGEKR